MHKSPLVRKYLSELGRQGGLARARSVPKARRIAIAKAAAKARWSKR